jgi:hypothetical protein
MSTTITHQCGHTVEHEQSFSDFFAERLAWKPCGDCFRAQYKADVEAARAASAGLPALTGSEKQVAWATKLRLDVIKALPEARELARVYSPDARYWIDWRTQPADSVQKMAREAHKDEAEEVLVRACAAAFRSLLVVHDPNHDSMYIDGALQRAVLRVVGPMYREIAWSVIIMIAANRDLFLELSTVDGDDVTPGNLGKMRADVLAAIDKQALKCDGYLKQAREERAAKIAADKRAKELEAAENKAYKEREAARAAAEAAAIAARRAPFLAVMTRLAWDDEDGYWTRRLTRFVHTMGWPAIESHSRGIEALRVLFTVPNRDVLKRLERIDPGSLFDVALDAQRLANAIGAPATRIMHVAAGMPKPVIKRASNEAARERLAKDGAT